MDMRVAGGGGGHPTPNSREAKGGGMGLVGVGVLLASGCCAAFLALAAKSSMVKMSPVDSVVSRTNFSIDVLEPVLT